MELTPITMFFLGDISAVNGIITYYNPFITGGAPTIRYIELLFLWFLLTKVHITGHNLDTQRGPKGDLQMSSGKILRYPLLH